MGELTEALEKANEPRGVEGVLARMRRNKEDAKDIEAIAAAFRDLNYPASALARVLGNAGYPINKSTILAYREKNNVPR
jgi:hypothetical protein